MFNLIRKNGTSRVDLIDRISARLAEAGRLPKFCDLSRIGPLHLASVYSEAPTSAIIRESVQCGMDFDQNLAILKALIECVERLAIEEGIRSGHRACQTPRSDGFAAFPIAQIGSAKARIEARANAYAEALERFAWARWWDDSSIGATIYRNSDIVVNAQGLNLIEEIRRILPVEEVILVEPSLESDSHRVVIFYFVLKNLGLVSGGACGHSSMRDAAMVRALGELSRHMACAKKILNGATAATFYEQRLDYMATTQSSLKLADRIACSGSDRIKEPKLVIDEPVPHMLKDSVTVHRCLFADQPPFIGGHLERLCL